FCSFFFNSYRPPRHLPPFPTRRSSDLDTEDAMARSRSRITRRRFVYLAASAGAVAATARASAQSRPAGVFVSAKTTEAPSLDPTDRKSTRLNSSHRTISYAVFCLKKKK